MPQLIKKMGITSDAVLWTGDADVIPLRCDYFKSIPHVMKQRNVKVYMDALWDTSLPRYSMCYIAGYLSSWYNLTEEGSTLEEIMNKTLCTENVKMVYDNSKRIISGIYFNERFSS